MRRPPVSALLFWLGIAVALAAALAGASPLLLRLVSGPPWPAGGISEAIIRLALGLGLAGILVGLSTLLRIGLRLHSSLVRLEVHLTEAAASGRRPADSPAPSAPAPGESPQAPVPAAGDSRDGRWQEMLLLMQDIRDNTLLSEEQKAEKRLHLTRSEIEAGAARVRSLLSAGDILQARDLARHLGRKYPTEPGVRSLAAEVEVTRQRQESVDVGATTKQVNDLISMSAWARARQMAQELHERHPDNSEARALLLRIEREYRISQDEQQRRMYAEVQRFVTRRRWEEALAAAQTFIERFPGSSDAEAVRMQIPTLEANAEIEVRQQMEARIMEWAKHGRYIEAAELARTVIEKYPDSPQAEALRAQLPRLDELATNPDAPPARVRLE
jgi:tetratricopeptide (TPR) repeat protein